MKRIFWNRLKRVISMIAWYVSVEQGTLMATQLTTEAGVDRDHRRHVHRVSPRQSRKSTTAETPSTTTSSRWRWTK